MTRSLNTLLAAYLSSVCLLQAHDQQPENVDLLIELAQAAERDDPAVAATGV